MNEVTALLEQRAKLIQEAGAIAQTAKAAGREMTADEEGKFDRMHNEAAELQTKADDVAAKKKAAAERQQRQEQAEATLRQPRGRQVPAGQPTDGTDARAGGRLNATFRGQALRLPDGRSAHRATAGYVDAFRGYLVGETGVGASLQTDVAGDGGYLAPPQFVAELIAELDNEFWFRRLARVLPMTVSPKLTMPRRTARMNAFVWGGELTEPTPDTGLKFGTYNLTPHYMTGEIEVSNDLLAAAVLDADAIVRGEIRFNSGELEEQAFFYGDGQGKPLGVFVDSDQGVPASRNKTGVLTNADVFLDAKLSLRSVYLNSPSLRWIFHRNAVRTLCKLKSTAGEYLFLPSTREGEPDRLLGVATAMSEYAPAGTGASETYTTGDQVGLIGDLKHYDILDGLDMGVVRLTDSRYARKNMVGYIVRRKVDGCPRHGEAFSRVIAA